VGDTVRALYSGVVTSELFDQEQGNKLTIQHEGKMEWLETSYAHLASFLVSEGTHVVEGQPIGIVGDTGRTTRKHLYFETRVNGELTGPMDTVWKVKKWQEF
jgi:murein DD-endopeptidase MepM/ murein hydrolase activator NlpD